MKWTVNCRHPGYPAASSSSQVYLVYLERLSAQVHCNLGPISSVITMRHFWENGSRVIAEICSFLKSTDVCIYEIYL